MEILTAAHSRREGAGPKGIDTTINLTYEKNKLFQQASYTLTLKIRYGRSISAPKAKLPNSYPGPEATIRQDEGKMADRGRGEPEEDPHQGNLLNELETMYKKVSEENFAEPGVSKESPPQPAFQSEPEQPGLPLHSYEDSTSPGPPGKKGGMSVARFFLFSVPIVLIAAFALFIWPTPYQYGALKQGGKIYLVKTNRLTNTKSYFYGGKWMNAPLPDASGLRLPDPLSVKSPGDVPAQLPDPTAMQKTDPAAAQKSEPPAAARTEAPAAAVKAETPQAAVQKAEPARPDARKAAPPPTAQVQEPARASVKETEKPAVKEAEKEEIKTAPVKAEPSAKRAGMKRAASKKPYAVQIRSFQSREEMTKFLEDHRGESEMHWAKARVGSGTWYRVFIGRFGNQDEAKGYIRKKQLEAAYPGSFVQKIR